MTAKRRFEYLLKTVILAIFLATPGAEFGRGQAAVSPSREPKNAAVSNDFADRVQAYVKLHNSIESSLPALKPTDQPEKIANHQQALARRIREARRHARRGDMFSEEARKAFGPFADALVLDQQISGEKAKKELGWAPRAGSVLDDLKTGSYAR